MIHYWILIRSRRNPYFTIQENGIIQFVSGGLKSGSCALLFAAWIKIGFVLFKMKLMLNLIK